MIINTSPVVSQVQESGRAMLKTTPLDVVYPANISMLLLISGLDASGTIGAVGVLNTLRTVLNKVHDLDPL